MPLTPREQAIIPMSGIKFLCRGVQGCCYQVLGSWVEGLGNDLWHRHSRPPKHSIPNLIIGAAGLWHQCSRRLPFVTDDFRHSGCTNISVAHDLPIGARGPRRRPLQTVRDIHDHGKAGRPHSDEAPGVDHQVLVPKRGSPLAKHHHAVSKPLVLGFWVVGFGFRFPNPWIQD